MFSKKMIMIVGAIILIAVNIIILSVNSQDRTPSTRIGQVALFFISPFQEFASSSIHFVTEHLAKLFRSCGCFPAE